MWGLPDSTCGHSLRQRSKSRAGSHLSIVHVFYVIPHTRLSVGGSYTILVYITVGEVMYHPTRWPSKLLSLWDPINHLCASTISMLVTHGPIDAVLNQHRWWLPHQSSEYENSPLSSFPSGILHNPLIGPTRSHISATDPIANINHIEPPLWEGTLSWAVINHSASTCGL
jgi:hypothetical protein